MITKGKWTIYEDGMTCITDIVAEDGIGFFTEKVANITYRNKDNADFIVSACNACKSVNEEHPELVAKHIKEMYEALRGIITERTMCHEREAAYIPPHIEAVYSVLSKIKGGE